MEQIPDKWLGLKISGDDGSTCYRIFASWYGGYLSGDSWRMNSGVVKASLIDDLYSFEGSSGSIYLCRKNNYGAGGYAWGVLNDMIDKATEINVKVEIMPEDTDWLSLDYDQQPK